jgi:nitrogen fixation/metabolism regulation signal transduction histidine kinase
MDFNWRSPFFTRIAFLVITAFILGTNIAGKFSFSLTLILGVAIFFQVVQLIKMIEAPATGPSLLSVKFDEVTQTFKNHSKDHEVTNFCSYLNDSLTKVKNNRKEKNSEYHFFKNIVQHVGIGILTFDQHGAIQIMNSAAKKLLRVTKADKLEDLEEVDVSLVDVMRKLRTGGRELLQLKMGDESIQLSIYAIELTLKGETMKLISMSNIQSELEEKEMEAWQNLVRVLTHEIMNSVTPISSLAGVVESELEAKIKHPEIQFDREEMSDMHLSVQTISKRSEGLIRFVKEFRNLTHVPKPKISTVLVKDLLEEMAMLHKKELADNSVTITISVYPEDMKVDADKTLIEQVLINLIKNAIQSFDQIAERNIRLMAFINDGKPVITVKDNGTGIEPEALEKIFIPFFSTKKTGSGIGLSLSRQIMRQHGGQITVKSKLGEGTEFSLRF